MQTITATFRINTPMFLGGADQQAEFRLASFKGVLRFWWRALEWDRLRDLKALRAEEARLFGSSDNDVGQSQVLMRLKPPPKCDVVFEKTQLKDIDGTLIGLGARYLGYGVIHAYPSRDRHQEAELIRPCIAAPDSFSIEFRFKRETSEVQRSQVKRALKILGLLGGIGSKSRKGYGSLTLLKLETREPEEGASESWTAPKTLDEFQTELSEILMQTGKTEPALSTPGMTEFTAFSRDSQIVAIEGWTNDEGRKVELESALHLLDRIGREIVQFRSWGKDQMVLRNVRSEKNFQPDHDLMKLAPSKRTAYPQRIAFGLPHNYGKYDDQQVQPDDSKLDRRASPLFVHIHHVDGSPPIGVLTFFPCQFLPIGHDKISVGGQPIALHTATLWQPITDFLDRLLNPSSRKEFSATDRVKEVWHG